MAELVPVFKVTKSNGVWIMQNPEALAKFKNDMKPGEYFLSIALPKKMSRSQQQNKFYWSAIIKPYSNHLGYTPEELHAIFGSMFLLRTVEFKGNTVTYIKSTTKLDTEEMSGYLQCCIQEAAENDFVIADIDQIKL